MIKYRHLTKLNYRESAFKIEKILKEIKKSGHDFDVSTIEYHLKGSNIIFYEERLKHTPLIKRLTLPFALIFYLLMLIFSPFKYIVTGKWGYDSERLYNWYKSLGF